MSGKTGGGYASYAYNTWRGTPYSHAGTRSGIDCSQFVGKSLKSYCGLDIGSNCASQYSNFTKKKVKGAAIVFSGSSMNLQKYAKSKIKVGDLIYKMRYDGSNNHVMIADGNGGVYESSCSGGGVRHKTSYNWAYKDVDLVVRIFETAGTITTTVDDSDSHGGDSEHTDSSASSQDQVARLTVSTVADDSSAITGDELSRVDEYKKAMESALSTIGTSSRTETGSSGVSYPIGFLMDLTHNNSMRFILPEISESFSPNYDPTSIPGRSAEFMAYSSTSSTTRSIKLDLLAGEGLYIGSDPVGSMHKDLSFLRSLVYPDYSSDVVSPPSTVLLYLGPNSIIKGVVSSLSIELLKPYTIDGISMRAEVNLTVTQSTDAPADYSDMLNRTTRSY